MATQNADGTYDDSSPITTGLGGILQAVLGKETDTDTQSTQNTAANTSTSGSTTGTANTTQNSTGTTAGTQTNSGATTGVQTSTGTQSNVGSQNTSGTTATTGTQATTGTVTNSGTSQVGGTTVQRTDADTAALQSVYDRQSAGITPEMLAAIFREGSKAAPQLVVAQSNALGARATGNSPVAQSLNMLNSELVNKAADMNRQLLSDAGKTAAQIADLTKSVTGTTDQTTTNLSTQVQDLLTQNDSTSIVNQIVATLNNQTSAGTQNTSGTSTGTQNTTGTSAQTQTGTQATTGTSASTGTQNQSVNATENKDTKTTINTSAAKSLLRMAAAGAGLAALYRVATGSGFTGAVGDFVNWLRGQGAQVGTDGTVNIPDYIGGGDGTGIPDVNIPDYLGGGNPGSDEFGAEDWTQFGFADGGQVPFLPIDMLIKKQNVIGNPDADLNGLMSSLTGSGNGSEGGGGGNSVGGGTSAGGTSSGAGGEAPGVGSSGSGTGSTGFTINDQGIAIPDTINTTGISAVLSALGIFGMGVPAPVGMAIGQAAKASNADNVAAANSANVAMKDSNAGFNGSQNTPGSAATAGPTGTGGIAANAAEAAAAAAKAAGASDAAMGAAAQAAADAVRGGASPAAAAAAGAAAAGVVDAATTPVDSSTDLGVTESAPTPGGSVAPAAASSVAPAAGVGGSDGGGYGGSGGATGGADTGGFGGEYADGGEVESEDPMHEIGEAMGLAIKSNSKMMKFMLAQMTKPKAKPAGYADGKMVGNQIRGPGNGVSDSIQAVGPQGQPIKVSNQEMIIPADVVQKFGASAFEKLIAEHHVPADMQRAITGG